MKTILILSDSHGLTKEMEQILQRHDTDYVFHCGDSELAIHHPLIEKMHIVKGNCDFGVSMPEEKWIDIQGIRFFLTHGHLYQVGHGLTNLSYRASEENAQIICYGHTHRAGVIKINKQIFINPGSIYSSRDRRERTYALLTLENGKHLSVTFYTTDGRVLEELAFQHKLA